LFSLWFQKNQKGANRRLSRDYLLLGRFFFKFMLLIAYCSLTRSDEDVHAISTCAHGGGNGTPGPIDRQIVKDKNPIKKRKSPVDLVDELRPVPSRHARGTSNNKK
jgi:hypothetical protein